MNTERSNMRRESGLRGENWPLIWSAPILRVGSVRTKLGDCRTSYHENVVIVFRHGGNIKHAREIGRDD